PPIANFGSGRASTRILFSARLSASGQRRGGWIALSMRMVAPSFGLSRPQKPDRRTNRKKGHRSYLSRPRQVNISRDPAATPREGTGKRENRGGRPQWRSALPRAGFKSRPARMP